MVDRGRAEAADYAGYALDDGTPAINSNAIYALFLA